LFYSYYFKERAEEKKIIREKERNEQMDVILEGIKSIISVIGGH